MGYPVGPLLRELAGRILANLDHIERFAPQWAARTKTILHIPTRSF